VPYYSVGRKTSVVGSTSLRLPYNTISGGDTLANGSYEIGYRTRLPTGDEVREIALNVAEPYSWWVDYQTMKLRNAARLSDFDTTKLTKDRGHTWLFEEFKLQNLQDFKMQVSSESYEIRNAFPYYSTMSPVNLALPSSSIESWAALQYGRMAPVVGDFSISTFLGELREGLPRLIPRLITSAKTAKSAGEDYLNLEFGWKPLLNDLQDLADTLLQASFGLFRPMNASHRRRERPVIETSSEVVTAEPRNVSCLVGNIGSPSGYNPYSSTGISFHGTGAYGIGKAVQKTKLKQWCEGEFVYIPKAGFDPSNFLDRYETLVNVNITPAVLWELAPWSWLVDWAAQIGAQLSAMEAGLSNRILSTYFYGMEEATASLKSEVLVTGNQSGRVHVGPKFMNAEMHRRRRRRIRANPFGYTGDPNTALNGSQMAILGALGLTRLR